MRLLKGCIGTLIVLAIVLVAIYSSTFPKSVTSPATPTPKGWFDQAHAQSLIEASLLLKASHIRVDSIQIADGRAKGGERVVILSYLPASIAATAITDDLVLLFSSVEVALRRSVDIDSVSIVVGSGVNDSAAGIVTVSMADIQQYAAGKLSIEGFVAKFVTVTL